MSSCDGEIALPDLQARIASPYSAQFSQVIHWADKTSSYSAATKAINVISGFALKPMQDIIFCHMCVTGTTLWLLSYSTECKKLMCCS